MIIGNVNLRRISADLSSENIERIKIYLQGAVYCWCKNCKNENIEPSWFAARDLFGGDNYYWEGTPLYELYLWHLNNNAEDPVNMAGRDVGNLLKEILYNDKRSFYTREGYTREYQWDGKQSIIGHDA